MKLAARQVSGFLRSPPSDVQVFVLYGPDATLTDEARETLAGLFLGDDPDPFRRVTVEPDAARRATAALADACAAVGFGGGDPVVICRGATDAAAKGAAYALERMPAGSRLILTAGELKPASALRKFAETAPGAAAVPLYPEDGAQLEQTIVQILRDGGVQGAAPEALSALCDLCAPLDRGQMRRQLEVFALYKHGDSTELSLEDVAAIAPAGRTTALALAGATARGEAKRVSPLVHKLVSAGAGPADLIREVKRCFADAHGAALGAAPGRGPRERERIVKFLTDKRSTATLEVCLRVLHDAEATLRRGVDIPELAFVERALLRVAMAGR